MKTTEELFEERYGKPKDKWDNLANKYTYWDMLDFADHVCNYHGVKTQKLRQ